MTQSFGYSNGIFEIFSYYPVCDGESLGKQGGVEIDIGVDLKGGLIGTLATYLDEKSITFLAAHIIAFLPNLVLTMQ